MLSYDEQLWALAHAALEEDIGNGDHSTLSCIPPGEEASAILRIKEEGILAGVQVAEKIFRMREPGAVFRFYKKDGDRVKAGETAFEVHASMHNILQCERVVLNCMQRMSGIATLTRRYAEKLKGYKTRILDTRKSTPNFRLLEKEAVRIGGGMNHRFGLFDMIMLKDNHIDFCGGIEEAIRRADDYRKKVNPDLKIEIETRNLDDVKRVMALGRVDRILLDNFSPAQIRIALQLIDGKLETEASGGINLDNLIEFAETGVDFVSIGALIHQAQSLDLSLKAVPVSDTVQRSNIN